MTQWSFTVDNRGVNFPEAEALHTPSMTLYFACEFQFFTKEEEKIPKFIANFFWTKAIPLRFFQVNTEATFNYLLSTFHIDSANPESLDMKGLVQLALSLASTKVPLRVRLTAATVMSSEEIQRMREGSKDEVKFEFVEIKDKDERCAICLEEFDGTWAMPMRVECKHIYHKPCFDKWHSYAGRTCPMCRAAIWGEKGLRRMII